MKSKFLILVFVSAIVATSIAFAQEDNPYFYYYSADEQSIVVERADGSDRRGFSIGSHEPVFGPGFSPDGRWFASYNFQNQSDTGSVVSVDGTTIVDPVGNIKNLAGMYWSPDSQHILVAGSFDDCLMLTCKYQTYWLIDAQMNRIVATYDATYTPESPMDRFIEWSTDGEAVSFYTQEDNLGYLARTNVYFVTMGTDGTVTKRNVSWDEYVAANLYIAPDSSWDVQLVSPDGRYAITAGRLSDISTGQVIRVPTPYFPNPALVIDLADARWNDTSDWVLLGFRLSTGSAAAASIMRSDGTEFRQLNVCGFGPSCVGWLPDNVDATRIPLLEDAP